MLPCTCEASEPCDLDHRPARRKRVTISVNHAGRISFKRLLMKSAPSSSQCYVSPYGPQPLKALVLVVCGIVAIPFLLFLAIALGARYTSR
jgi:hypothetical protein